MKNLISVSVLSLIFTGLYAESVQDSYMFEAKGDYIRAFQVMEKICTAEERDYFANLRAGWLSYVLQLHAKSIAYYQKAIVIAPDAIEPRLGQLRPLAALEKQEQLQIAARGILKLDPKNYMARSFSAYSYFLTRNFKEAEKLYSSLVNDFPADTEMLIGLGWTNLNLGNKKNAKIIFLRASRILPEEPRIKNGLSSSE